MEEPIEKLEIPNQGSHIRQGKEWQLDDTWRIQLGYDYGIEYGSRY